MIKVSELKRLDKVSLAEIEKIIETYENLRMAITHDINFHGGIENYEKFLATAFKRWGDIGTGDEKEQMRNKKFWAILEQVKAELKGGDKSV